MSEYRTPGGHIEEPEFVVRGGGQPGDPPDAPPWQPTSVRVDEDRLLTRVSLAVFVRDAFTHGLARETLHVAIDGVAATPVRNRTGHYLFLDVTLPGPAITVLVEGGPLYRNASETVTLTADPEPTPPELNPARTAAEVTVTPTTQYPFPPGTTLVRGVVRDQRQGGDDPVPGATVAIEGLDRQAVTNDDGAFVLFFETRPGETHAAETTTAFEGGRWVLKVGEGNPTFVASGGDGVQASVVGAASAVVAAGRTTRVVVPYEDSP